MGKEGLGLEITELRLGLPGDDFSNTTNKKKRGFTEITDDRKDNPVRKSQVVGWPPVCSYRRKNSFNEKQDESSKIIYVKVGMDGAPFLRKIDLNSYKGYHDLALGLEKLFDCFGIALKDVSSCEYVPIYEDKDGDWMLAGDVPWEMFIKSCKRLRVMKRSEAKGFGLSTDGVIGDLNETS